MSWDRHGMAREVDPNTLSKPIRQCINGVDCTTRCWRMQYLAWMNELHVMNLNELTLLGCCSTILIATSCADFSTHS
jgi:hypothetical protein